MKVFGVLLLCQFVLAYEINLEVGKVKGKIEEAIPSGKKFAAFTSIPYAEPPIGKLRFKEPKGNYYLLVMHSVEIS